MGMAETEEALRAEVSKVCRFYYLQVRNEALDQAGVETFFTLRRAENVYYPLTIRTSNFSSSKADLVSKEAGEVKESPTKALPIANISLEAAEQFEDAGKAADITKDVA